MRPGVAQWWTFLEQREDTAGWDRVGVAVFSGFVLWLRNGRTVEHSIARQTLGALSPETLEARLAALISFYRWHGEVNDVVVADKLLAGRPRRGQARGLLSHLDSRSGGQSSSLVRVRASKHRDRTPLLLPTQVQEILDACATFDPNIGEWQGNLRDRFLFSLLAETGLRLGEALGVRIDDFVMGRGGAPYVEVVAREDNPNGARVKMLRSRRVYVGSDLERLYADYLTHLACRAAGLGIHLSSSELLFRNLDRPPWLSPLRDATVRDKVSALKRRGIGPEGWTAHWLRHTHATALLLGGTPEWVVARRMGHSHVQTTLDLYGWVSEDEALAAAANWKSYTGDWKVTIDAS